MYQLQNMADSKDFYCILQQETIGFSTVPVNSLSSEHSGKMGKLVTRGQRATTMAVRITVGTGDHWGQSEARSKGCEGCHIEDGSPV